MYLWSVEDLSRFRYLLLLCRFLHDLDKEMSFQEASRDAGITAGGVYAGKILDQALDSQKISLEGMDYLNILTTVFSQVWNEPTHLVAYRFVRIHLHSSTSSSSSSWSPISMFLRSTIHSWWLEGHHYCCSKFCFRDSRLEDTVFCIPMTFYLPRLLHNP